MSMAPLQSRLSLLKGEAPSAATFPSFSGTSRGQTVSALGDLRFTIRASPPGQTPWNSYSSRSDCPVWLPSDFAGPSHEAASIPFEAPPEDRMLIGDGLSSSKDEDSDGAGLTAG